MITFLITWTAGATVTWLINHRLIERFRKHPNYVPGVGLVTIALFWWLALLIDLASLALQCWIKASAPNVRYGDWQGEAYPCSNEACDFVANMDLEFLEPEYNFGDACPLCGNRLTKRDWRKSLFEQPSARLVYLVNPRWAWFPWIKTTQVVGIEWSDEKVKKEQEAKSKIDRDIEAWQQELLREAAIAEAAERSRQRERKLHNERVNHSPNRLQ